MEAITIAYKVQRKDILRISEWKEERVVSAHRLTRHIIYSRGNTSRQKATQCFIFIRTPWGMRFYKPIHSFVSLVCQVWLAPPWTLRNCVAPSKRHQPPPAAATATRPSSLSICVSDSTFPRRLLIGSGGVGDADKVGRLLLPSEALTLALYCCHPVQ